jgi:hypothetical protein
MSVMACGASSPRAVPHAVPVRAQDGRHRSARHPHLQYSAGPFFGKVDWNHRAFTLRTAPAARLAELDGERGSGQPCQLVTILVAILDLDEIT